MKRSVSVSADLCCHCGMCVQDCIMGAIALNDDQIPAYTDDGEERCIECQHCMAVCPTGAFSFGGRNPEDSLPVGSCRSEDLLRLIRSRRSVRAYRKDDVDRKIIDQMTAILPYAPTGGNRDDLFFSLVGSRRKMDEIRNVTYAAMESASDPVPLFRMALEAHRNGNDLIYRDAPAMIAVAYDRTRILPGCEAADPIIALSYLDLYAQSLGVGTVWCGYALLTMQKLPEVLRLLELPPDHTLAYIMLFGLPAVRYTRTIQPDRTAVRLIQ